VRARKRIKRELTYWLLRIITLVPSCLPRRLALHMGTLIGVAGFLVAHRQRRRAMRHLRLAYPESSRGWCTRTTLRAFVHLAWNTVDFFHFAARPPSRLAAVWRVSGNEHLEAAVRAGRGAVCITGHVSNWELLGACVVQMGYPLTVLARKLYYPKLDRWVNVLRNRMGMEVLDRNIPPGELLSRLRRGGFIGILMDQDTRARGIFVEFFGRPAYTPVGPAVLALRTGAAVVLAFMKRMPDHTYHITISAPHGRTAGAPRPTVRELTAWATEQIERAIRDRPEQWVWIHQRWRTQPASTDGLRPQAAGSEIPR
jgi:KDO2-lipid IV(A) lauroyltransferase